LIVKIQRSQPPSPRGLVLMYTRRMRAKWMGPIAPDVDRWMGKRQKTFAHAHIEGTLVVIDKQAPWQDW
jgi:hypothetical protein